MTEVAPLGPTSPGRPDWRRTLLPLPGLAVAVGGFLAAYGALSGRPSFLLTGLVLIGVGLGLFAYEQRWTSRLIRSDGRPEVSTGPTPWWKRPISYRGRWMCTSCGWREETRTTFCPRCGKVLVQLPTSPIAKS